MNNEFVEEIIKTRDIEVKHTLETRQIAFDRDVVIRNAIFELIHILVRNDTISLEDAEKIYDALRIKEEENEGSN